MPSSTSSSRSSSPELSDTMQIFVKKIAGETIPITASPTLTIQNLTTLLSLRTSLPEADLRLVYASKHLSASRTLADYNITREATLHLAMPLRGGMPPKKIRCGYKDCREGAQRIVGDCGFCNGHYCGNHRLLEDHKCSGLEDVSFPISSSAFYDGGDKQWWLVGLDPELWADDDTQCKKESHDRNAAQLNAERTQVIKGI